MEQDSIYIMPARARARMKQAKAGRQPVFLHAPTGYGKTAFIRHFLEKDSYTYIDAESMHASARRCPEAGESRDILVIDDLQFGDKALLSELLAEQLHRRDNWVILLSRARCPDYLAAFQYKGTGFAEITAQELRLSEQETAAFFREQGLLPDQDTMEMINSAVQGHGMTLRILSELLRQEAGAIGNTGDILARCEQQLLDYLGTEIYDRWDPYYADTICQLSVVESFTKELAVCITGTSQIELLLQYAAEVSSFPDIRDGEYCLGTLARKSLQRRLEKRFSRTQIDDLYANAGRYYRQRGEYQKALALFADCRNTAQIKEILVELAQKQPGSTRLHIYKSYYRLLSDADIAQSPELMSGMSMICSLTMNIEKSEYWYDRLKQEAKEGPAGQRKLAAEHIAYLDVALPHRGSRDTLSLLLGLGKQLTSRTGRIRAFSVTGNSLSNLNGGKDFCEWTKRDLELAGSVGPIVSLVIGDYGKGLVDLCVAESFFEKGMDDYEVIRRASRGLMQAENGNLEERLVGQAILGRLHTRRGHIEDSREILTLLQSKCEQEDAPWLIPNIRSSLCQLDLYCGRTWHYQEWLAKEAPAEGEDFIISERYRYLTKIRIYLVLEKFALAQSLIERKLYYAEHYDRPYIWMETTMLSAILQHRLGNAQWKDTLQSVYTKAEEYHFVRVLTKDAGAALALFRGAKLTVMDEAFHEQVLQELRCMERYYPAYLKESAPPDALSDNGLQVLRLQAEGFSNEKIAEQMEIAVSTVKYHCRENYAKLGVKNRSGAVSEARRRKLIP